MINMINNKAFTPINKKKTIVKAIDDESTFCQIPAEIAVNGNCFCLLKKKTKVYTKEKKE